MSTKVTEPAFHLPIVGEDFKQLQEFNSWVGEVTRAIPLVGTGTPEGSVSAVIGQLYVDTTGSSGSVLYVKQLSGIGGDDTQGWVAVG